MIRRPAVVLALLTALNLLNYLDRFVLAAVLPRIERDLGLSHTMGGLLGTIFLVGYLVTSPAFGMLADRGGRTRLIALGIFVWSAATIVSGLATGLVSLATARAAVGVGEASYATIAPTIIYEVAPPEKRSRWLAVFYAAAPIGSALGYVVGGLVEHLFGWRAAFFVAGGPGIALAVACLFMVDPPREEVAKHGGFLATFRPLARIPLYVRAVLGYAAYTFAIGGFALWGPSYLFQRFESSGLTLVRANMFMGGVTVVAGALGTAIGGSWGDRARGAGVTPLLRICAIGSVVGAPLAALAVLSPTPTLFFTAFFFCNVALFLSTSPINGAVLGTVPATVRASAMAVCISGIHVLGDLWSPVGIGVLADLFTMQTAMLVLPVAILVSGAVWWPPAGSESPSTG
jgi:predicted MFS family arabinose efflux permease